MPLAMGFALLIGASLAVFGAGGSILTMPVLVYALRMSAHEAAGTSLLVVGAVAVAGAAAQWRLVQLRTGLLFGLAGMAGAIPGAWANHHAPATAVMAGLALVMLVAAARMGWSPLRPVAGGEVHQAAAIALGVGVGVATGFFGVGGGFLIVPALTLLLGMPVRPAVATSLLVIALNSLAGLAGHVSYGGVAWQRGAEMTLAALAGAALAVPLGRRLSGPRLQRAFAGALGVLGFVILVGTVREWLG
jgi:hypothetical protein